MSKFLIKPRVREYVLSRDKGTCQYCGTTERVSTVDHVIPQSDGGTHEPDNLVACCFQCNATKRNRSLGWMRLLWQLRDSPYGQVIRPWQYKELVALGVKFDPLPEVKFYFELARD